MMEALILVGGLTFHPMNPDANYANKIAPVGGIVNPYSIVMMGSSTIKGGMILGRDSKNRPISGLTGSYQFHNNLALVVGGYNDTGHNQNTVKMFNKKLVPVLGVDASFKLYQGKGYSIESHNVLSIITTHSIGVKFDF